ncbi:unnamed protein product [Effrenium voratum]|uniref:Uncharacterized protein n=1 Tax=Effrenium voratum TaxID=2562239 RepID=A0AA36JLW8_9DINO|nr:unnamed protein product [Effrenium voratum]
MARHAHSGSEVPWWVLAALPWLILMLKDSPGSMESEGRRLHDACRGTLADVEDSMSPPAKVVARNESGEFLEVYVPCWLWVTPCDHVVLPPQGLTFQHPFGNWTAGADKFHAALDQTEHAFGSITIICAAVFAAVSIAVEIYGFLHQEYVKAHETKEQRKLRQLEEEVTLKYGVMELDDADTEEQLMQDRRDRLDENAPDFIAQGNIYRVLAVMHPLPKMMVNGRVMEAMSLWTFLGNALKALICSFMQLSLPVSIIKNTLEEWQFDGAKSPLWFMENYMVFMVMFASLGSVCALFQGRVVRQIRNGAEGSFHILTHRTTAGVHEQHALQAYLKEEPDTLEVWEEDLLNYMHEHDEESDSIEDDNRPNKMTQFFNIMVYMMTPKLRLGLLRPKLLAQRVAQKLDQPSPETAARRNLTRMLDGRRDSHSLGKSSRVASTQLQHGLREDGANHKLSGRTKSSTNQSYSQLLTQDDDEYDEDEQEMIDLYQRNAPMLRILDRANRVLWCFVSEAMTSAMSLMLQFCMFMKVATFTGQIAQIAVVAVSLYFVFDLDTRIFEADTTLRLRYRQHVRKLVVKTKPRWPGKFLLSSAFFFTWLARLVTPMALYGIVIFAWKNRRCPNLVIGGCGLD